MRFRIEASPLICSGDLTYVADDYSFQFQSATCDDTFTSIVVNDLQLEINEDGRVLYVWGLCPHTSWLDASLTPPPSHPGILTAIIRQELIPGVSIRLTPPGRWPVFADRQTGWVCLGDSHPPDNVETVEFATSSLAILKHGELEAIWLQPQKLPKRVGWLRRLFSRCPPLVWNSERQTSESLN